jgi:hypothetical protein
MVNVNIFKKQTVIFMLTMLFSWATFASDGKADLQNFVNNWRVFPAISALERYYHQAIIKYDQWYCKLYRRSFVD